MDVPDELVDEQNEHNLRTLGGDQQTLVPSSVPLVGAQIASYKCSMQCCMSKQKCAMRIDPTFVRDLLWALRCAVGVTIAALPTFLTWTRENGLVPELDLAYATVTYIFVSGRTLGETVQLTWQAACGSITAAIAPQLAINTIPDDWWGPVGLFVFFYTLVVLSLPMESITKKFALGTTLQYLMHSAKHSSEPQPDPVLPSSVTYHVLLLGLWGCVPALLQVSPLGLGRRAVFEAKASADKLVLDIKLVVGLLLHGYCEGLSALDRTRLVKYFAEMERGIADMSRALKEAWYEPGSTRQVAQLSTVLRMVYKLRAELFGMQQALISEQDSWAGCSSEDIGDKEQAHGIVMMHMRRPMAGLVRQSLELLTAVVSLINDSSETKFQIQPGAAGDTDTGQIFGDLRHNLARQKIKKMIEDHLDSIGNSGNDGVDGKQALQATKKALTTFHKHLSKLRDETKESEHTHNKKRDERVEMDSALMMFLFSVTGLSQQLLDFPDEYAFTMEEAQQRKSRFAADTKMVALQFQRKQLLAAVKTAIAVTLAATFNATRATFNYEATAPLIIAYLMPGHVGARTKTLCRACLGCWSAPS